MDIKKPKYYFSEDFQNRLKKYKELKEEYNIDIYPHKYITNTSIIKILEKYKQEEIGDFKAAKELGTPLVKISGRLILFRPMGKNIFAQIKDGIYKIQIMLNRDLTKLNGHDQSDVSDIKLIEKKIDLGDIIGIEGHLFRTQKKEITILVTNFTILCKSLLPLPDKHSGLMDKETIYRKRWLDLISNDESMKKFVLRSRILKLIREFFYEKEFLEVETPILQNSYGGAEARPFTSHLNALDQDMYLRISLEIPLKKLVVGGFNKVFEIGKVFRNESIDKTHNPEFTLLECYSINWDYNDMMDLTELLFEKLALTLFNDTKFETVDKDGKKHILNVSRPWKRLTMKESIKVYANIEVDKLKDEELKDLLINKTRLEKEDIQKKPRGLLIAAVFEELVEEFLIQPHHIIDHPIETTPLCKLHRDTTQKRIVERFESFILRKEITNAYSELNDPVLQRDLLEEQEMKKEAGDETANPLDEEFIEAICQGMPPTGGLGIGLDRVIMLFTHSSSIRDIILFPLMKPEK